MAWLESLGGDSGGGSGTPITPSNSSPVQLNNGETYETLGNGLAIESLRNITPSNSSPIVLTSGEIDKMGGNGYAIQSYNTKTPSSTPVSVSSGEIDKMGGNGYLINSYANITPSKDGAYFSSGMNKMSSSGYAYSSKPTLKATTLWTNPAKDSGTSSTSFTAQPITLNQSYEDFIMLGVYWQFMYGSTVTTGVNAIRVSDFPVVSTSDQAPRLVFGYYGGSSYAYNYMRTAYATSNTALHINSCLRYNSSSSTTSNTRCIPIYVYGYSV